MLVNFSTIQIGSTFGAKLGPVGIYLRIDQATNREDEEINAVLLNSLTPGTFRFFAQDEEVFGPLSVSESLVLMLETDSLIGANSTLETA